MMDELLRKSLKITIAITLIITAVLVLIRKLPWAGGFIIASIWSTANFLFTVNLLKIAVLKQPKERLFSAVMLKFPLLYLSGFLILRYKWFPVSSLLAGLAPFLAVTTVLKLCQKQPRT